MSELRGIPPPDRLFRVGRPPDPWAWPPWHAISADEEPANRWDDPERVYRVLYACTQLEGCFVETLARFRLDARLVAELAEIEGDDDPVPAGVVPRDWLDNRVIGECRVSGLFADVGHAASLAHLQRRFAARLVHHGIAELDGAAIRQSAPRRFTQEISNYVYRCSRDGESLFSGIEYESRLGDNYQNWAIFERPGLTLESVACCAIEPDDPALQTALKVLGLRLGD